MRLHWKEKYAKGGVCDFRQNYDFYFKWLLNKTMQCIFIKGLPNTIKEAYLKSNLLLDGNICITDFNDKLYACIGSQGGEPNEYYVGTKYTIANPVLGSKMVDIGKTGVVIYNNDMDEFTGDCWVSGIYELINQTATLLADNIISINCAQINCRVQAMITADSESQAAGGEIVLKKLYAGQPFQILRSDLIDKINVNPINTAANSQNLSELVELHNYIIANYFQSIGIRSNNIRKRSHVLQDEIDVQNDYLQVSIFEILTSWQKGFDEVNAMYGTDIHVELNPALLDTLIEDSDDNSDTSGEAIANNEDSSIDETEDTIEDNSEESKVTEVADESVESIVDDIQNKEEAVQDIIDMINDATDDNVDTFDEEVDDNDETE